MADEKNKVIDPRNQDLGAIKKQLASGFWETSTGAKVPNLTGLKVGDKVKLVDGQYVINDGKEKKATPENKNDSKAVTALKKQIAVQDKKIEALEDRVAALEALEVPDGDGVTGDN